MVDRAGSIAYLRQMAERCRKAARELGGDEARELVALAEGCEARLAETEWARAVVASARD